jgi:hypothetical protein
MHIILSKRRLYIWVYTFDNLDETLSFLNIGFNIGMTERRCLMYKIMKYKHIPS